MQPLYRPQMTPNHDLVIVTLFPSALQDIMNHFLEFSIYEGVRHFLALFAQPPTPLLTLRKPSIPYLLFQTEWLKCMKFFLGHCRADKEAEEAEDICSRLGLPFRQVCHYLRHYY